MNLDVIISTTDGTSKTKFKNINIFKLISYLTKKYASSVNKNFTEGTAVIGKRSFNRQNRQVNQTNDSL